MGVRCSQLDSWGGTNLQMMIVWWSLPWQRFCRIGYSGLLCATWLCDLSCCVKQCAVLPLMHSSVCLLICGHHLIIIITLIGIRVSVQIFTRAMSKLRWALLWVTAPDKVSVFSHAACIFVAPVLVLSFVARLLSQFSVFLFFLVSVFSRVPRVCYLHQCDSTSAVLSAPPGAMWLPSDLAHAIRPRFGYFASLCGWSMLILVDVLDWYGSSHAPTPVWFVCSFSVSSRIVRCLDTRFGCRFYHVMNCRLNIQVR